MDRLTLPRYDALCRYWKKHPPVHLTVATIAAEVFGIGPKPSPKSNDYRDLAQLFGPGSG